MEVLLVGSVPITDHYLATDEYYILYCLRCLSDVVGFIFFFGVGVNDWFPTECLADCRFHCSCNNAVINPSKDCLYSCGFYGCMFVSRESVLFNIHVHLYLTNHDADIAAVFYGFRFFG